MDHGESTWEGWGEAEGARVTRVDSEHTPTQGRTDWEQLIFTWIPASCNQSCNTHRGSTPADSGLGQEYPWEPTEKPQTS